MKDLKYVKLISFLFIIKVMSNFKEWMVKSILVRAEHKCKLKKMLNDNRCCGCKEFSKSDETRDYCYTCQKSCCFTCNVANGWVHISKGGTIITCRIWKCNNCKPTTCDICLGLLDHKNRYIPCCMVCNKTMCEPCYKKGLYTSRGKHICENCKDGNNFTK